MNYISRFILWTGLCSVVLLSGGCRKHTLDSAAALEKKYPLIDAMLILRCNEMQTKAATREEQERQINDLNLFFVHKAYPSPVTPEVRHYYFSSADMDKHIKLTNIRLGEYRLYAIANVGRNLCPETSHDPTAAPAGLDVAFCSMTEAEIKALVVSRLVSDLKQANNLLMSSFSPTGDPNNPYCDEVAITRGDEPGTEGGLPSFTINLMRRMARVDFSYELFGEAEGLRINRIIPECIPLNLALFGKEGNRLTIESDRNEYVDLLQSEPTTGNMTDPITFYLPENRQGNVEGITSQQGRNATNAPKYASYIFVDGEYASNEQYGFSIYFGDDMEGGNFDVDGNAYYRMHLRLGGPDPNDVRISSLKIDVVHHFDGELKLNVSNETYADIELTCSNYFNDEVRLGCSTNGALGVSSFQVFRLNDDGSLGAEIPNVSEHGGFAYLMLETDNESGTHTMKFRVKYKQTALGDGGQTVTILFSLRTVRHGDTPTLHTHPITVKPF